MRAGPAAATASATAVAGARSSAGEVEVVVVGAGQAGLATGFYLRRAGLVPGSDFVVLDANEHPGGAWQHMWPSLHLFSPAGFSSLPGWLMPAPTETYPPARHVVDYLAAYEQRYGLSVSRGVRVQAVSRVDADPQGRLEVTAAGDLAWRARAVVSATGTWGRPFLPRYPGQESFAGRQLHSADYTGPESFAGARVVVVGGGNTAAQLLAELSLVADTSWVALRQPRFLPDDVDGRVLFDVATARRKTLDAGRADPGGVAGLGDVVMVPAVQAARDRGALVAQPMFERLIPTGVQWVDGTTAAADAIVWCTGFRPDLRHLAPLHLTRDGSHPATTGSQATSEPRLHLVGYGDWTGPASATLIGVGRTARDAASAVSAQLARR